MTHDIGSIINNLPSDNIRQQLRVEWNRVPSIIHTYSSIMYRGLNKNTGGGILKEKALFYIFVIFLGERPSTAFEQNHEELWMCIESAERFIKICENIHDEAGIKQ